MEKKNFQLNPEIISYQSTRGTNLDGDCCQDGNGTVREGETMWFFVPDRTRSRPVPSPVPVPVSTVFPAHCLPSSRLFPIPLFAQLFPSHPGVCKQFLQFVFPPSFLSRFVIRLSWVAGD